MNKPCSIIGGMIVSLCLLIRCRFRTGKGSYLNWRKETAFGKDGEFPEYTSKNRRKSIRRWASWAWKHRE
ncbi:MAG: hypothetical protein QF718_00735 [Phycisphaerales bacterium]|nr:hypothetical protein [Phycisphaerales bacterium]